jgi:hypothetical protein
MAPAAIVPDKQTRSRARQIIAASVFSIERNRQFSAARRPNSDFFTF